MPPLAPSRASGAPGLRARLASGQRLMGTWLTLADPAVAELMAQAGMDFLTIDLEHSSLDLFQAAALIRVAELSGAAPLVRLSDNDPVQIKRVMDAGAHGIIVPMVCAAADVSRAWQALHYPPRGRRGVGLARAQAYGEGFGAYRAWLDEQAVLVAQIEHKDALAALDEILAQPGLDAFLVGPYDLSASMGIAGQFEHPDFIAALEQILAAGRRHGVPAGVHVVEPDPVQLRARLDQGYRLVAWSVDFRMLAAAARQGLAVLAASGGACSGSG